MGILDRYLPAILRVTGAVTMLSGLQFLAPTLMLRAQGLDVSDDAGLFFARHWALVVCCLGGLLYYSARQAELRRPVIFVATLEKLALVLMVVMNGSNPALAGMRPAAIFDALCVLLFSALMWRWLQQRPDEQKAS